MSYIKLHTALLVIASTMLTASCAYQDEQLVADSESRGISITASLELPQDSSRTYLDNEEKVVWADGDSFSLLTEKSNDRFDLTEGGGTATASFSGQVTGSGPYYALYPYSENNCIKDGNLIFSLPQEQTYIDGSFDTGTSPAIASLQEITDPAAFKNLCSILQINLCGTSKKIKGIEIVNLDGKALWGECSLALDGKQGTDEQSLTVSGGNNKLKIRFNKVVSLKGSSPVVIDAVVPAGSFAKGFSVKVLDEDGAAISFLTAQNAGIKTARSFITPIEKVKIPANGEALEVNKRGYYKDVFMDGGYYLTHRTTLPVCPYLGLSLDYLATSDTILQTKVMIESDEDINGVLLYPDDEPRYRVIYVNGGKANSHGKSLGDIGRARVRTYVDNGGCYVGTCAGAFLAHRENDTYKYFNLLPKCVMNSSGLSESYDAGIVISKDSPLLNYGYDFEGDFYVDSVWHNGGGYMPKSNLPAGGELLATYDMPGKGMDGKGSVWAYKPTKDKGRVVVTGSHPEKGESGEIRDLMAAIVSYALDGAGEISTKCTLTNGYVRKQVKESGSTAGIGDMQYHHFKVNIPEGASNIKVVLESESAMNLHLAMRRADFAWRSDADFLLAQKGANKTMEFDSLEAGVWYISVYCPAAVTTKCADGSFKRTGDLEALNGVPYSISVSWE
ncbi:MAG: hypothetical protein MJY60_05755 [Bacteroidales bacterium]|nr:hypothetical protein [Bacteroidales bacterium]